jgi:hypothetical protein
VSIGERRLFAVVALPLAPEAAVVVLLPTLNQLRARSAIVRRRRPTTQGELEGDCNGVPEGTQIEIVGHGNLRLARHAEGSLAGWFSAEAASPTGRKPPDGKF